MPRRILPVLAPVVAAELKRHPAPAGPAILVADADAAIAELLVDALRSRFRVLAPISDLDFLPYAVRTCRPTLVILELQFGQRSAIQFLHDLSPCEGAPATLVFSSRAGELDCELALRVGARAVISKHGGLSALIRAVDAIVREAPSDSKDCSQPLLGALACLSCNTSEDVHIEVLWLLCSGFTYSEVANRIGRGEKVVQYHASAWRRQLGVHGINNQMDWDKLSFADTIGLQEAAIAKGLPHPRSNDRFR